MRVLTFGKVLEASWLACIFQQFCLYRLIGKHPNVGQFVDRLIPVPE